MGDVIAWPGPRSRRFRIVPLGGCEAATVSGEVFYLWNPRSEYQLKRQWFGFDQRLVIKGAEVEQFGILTAWPTNESGVLRVILRVMGREFDEDVTPGHDIMVWIYGLKLVVGVRAISGGRMLVDFGVPPDYPKVSVNIEDLLPPETEEQPELETP